MVCTHGGRDMHKIHMPHMAGSPLYYLVSHVLQNCSKSTLLLLHIHYIYMILHYACAADNNLAADRIYLGTLYPILCMRSGATTWPQRAYSQQHAIRQHCPTFAHNNGAARPRRSVVFDRTVVDEGAVFGRFCVGEASNERDMWGCEST